MATIVYSTFTAADSTPLAGFEDWTAHPQTDDGSFPLRIMSNRLNVASGTTNRLWYRNTATGTADYSVRAIIYRNASNNGNVGVCGRMDATAATFYHLRLTGTTLQLYKFIGGTGTQLGPNYSVTPSVGSSTEIELVCDGSSISGKIGGATVIGPITDTAITAPGFAGIRLSTQYFEYDDFGAYTTDAADTTAPTLTSPTGTATGATTASGTVSTNEANGTLYYLASANASESATTVKAASSQAVSATGSQSVTFSGLTASTTYYAHYVHRDAAGNDSTVASSASFTTSAAGDTTPPTLTGSITISALTTTSYTASWPAGSDNVAVTGYEYRIAGGSWVDAGNVLSVNITGRTPGATETFEVRAYDAVPNYSSALSTSVTLLSAVPTVTVTEPLKNNTGTLLASQSGITVAVLQASGLVSVYEATGLTTNASGLLAAISNAAMTTGQQYHVAIKLADGGVGITGPITAS